MPYPLISEYVEAIKSAEDNFGELSYLRPVLGDDGLPVMTSGNFAIVFKMEDERDGKFYAVKCFTKEQEGRAEAYKQISEELKDVDSPYLISVRYLDKELFVDTKQTNETEFPVLLMDWVEGKTLDKYLRENLEDKYALEMLAYRFSQLAQWLIPQPFAHGDLKPDNIIVREDGTLVLVDYDGMYVPAMKGQKARELGSPDFRHPLRTEDDFDEHIDDFPLASILLSLKAVSINPLLLDEYGDSSRLLFSEMDYRNTSMSKLMLNLSYLTSIKEFSPTYSFYLTALTHYGLETEIIISTMNELNYDKVYPETLLFTKVFESDLRNSLEDDSGTEYSKDGKKLLKGCWMKDSYEIHMGTDTICDYAFSGKYYDDMSGCNEVDRIIIPQSVRNIGRNPFALCYSHITCNSPYYTVKDNVIYTSDMQLLIGFCGDYKIDSFVVPEGVKVIGDYAFTGKWNLKHIILPSTLDSIGNCAFMGCKYLERIEIPNELKYIGNYAFSDCENLKEVRLPYGLLAIGNYSFARCDSIQSITIPSTVICIGANPFLYISNSITVECYSYLYEVDGKALYSRGKGFLISCYSKEHSFKIPNEVTRIGRASFKGCPFRELYIHDRVEHIGANAFDGCNSVAYLYGYITTILVSKERFNWMKSQVTNMTIKEIENI